MDQLLGTLGLTTGKAQSPLGRGLLERGSMARAAGGRAGRMLAAAGLIGIGLVGLSLGRGEREASAELATATPIKHVVIIQQENRSFDSYFGTFPGADGIPMANGVPQVACNPDSVLKTCVKPFPYHADTGRGGPHATASAIADIAGGAMTGFQEQANTKASCEEFTDPRCGVATAKNFNDAMGYHTASDIPNYWAYAQSFVLQDRFFAATSSWSLPAHLLLVSGWSARCSSNDPTSCKASTYEGEGRNVKLSGRNHLAWTDLTYLLDRAGVSWAYYVSTGGEPDCAKDEDMVCTVGKQNYQTPGYWNPLPYFTTVQANHDLPKIQDSASFFTAAASGELPAVSWVIPNHVNSEHPPAKVSMGQSWVTRLVNAAMQGPDWSSTAIFISWDEWGGFYDHVVPPTVDGQGLGIRVPGLTISPYAKAGYVDHQVLSTDSYLRFVEDNFLAGQRLDPRADGRADPRPSVREANPLYGNLMGEFDFTQAPRKPLVLKVKPRTTLRQTGG